MTNKNLEYVPGPGNYQPLGQTTRVKSPTWRFGTANRGDNNPIGGIPGPGNYSVSTNLGNGPKYTITAKNFYGYDSTKSNNVPGPGQYNSNTSQTAFKQPTWRIGTATRDDGQIKQMKRENFPGPGNYGDTKSQGGVGPKFSFGHDESRSKNKVSSTPGPGQYKIPYEMLNHPNYSNNNGFDNSYKFI